MVYGNFENANIKDGITYECTQFNWQTEDNILSILLQQLNLDPSIYLVGIIWPQKWLENLKLGEVFEIAFKTEK